MEPTKKQQVPIGHPDDEQIRQHLHQLHSTTLDSSNLEFLEHVSRCSYCADKLARQIEDDGLLRAPGDFKANVLAQSRSARTQTELAIHKTSAKMQLFFYSLRVGGAILGALAILFLSGTAVSLREGTPPENYLPKHQETLSDDISVSEKLNKSSHQINQILQNFSDQLIHMEGIKND